jgi:DNA processing protein
VNDAPSLIYAKGNIDFENPKTVAIVGTRTGNTPTAVNGCEENQFMTLLPHHPLIVSGLAYGIDIHAHKVRR